MYPDPIVRHCAFYSKKTRPQIRKWRSRHDRWDRWDGDTWPPTASLLFQWTDTGERPKTLDHFVSYVYLKHSKLHSTIDQIFLLYINEINHRIKSHCTVTGKRKDFLFWKKNTHQTINEPNFFKLKFWVQGSFHF